MKKRLVSIWVCVLTVLLAVMPVAAMEIPDELQNLYAQSAVLMDADSGRILFGKNENEVLPMASTTKIMTCIIALEHMQEKQVCTVSEYAAKQPEVRLGMEVGDEYYLYDLLYSLMLESHNDSAVAIAEAVSGSVEGFMVLMNQKAKEIGCNHTYFITPNGLDAEDEQGMHAATAAELALIMKYCIRESSCADEFITITQTKEYQFSDVSETKNYSCVNHNAFLNMMEGVLAGKTGYTAKAGYCYVGALKDEDRTFIVSLLACGWPNHNNYKWSDTRKLMKYGIENYEYRNLWNDVNIEKIAVEKGWDSKQPFQNVRDVDVYIDNKQQCVLALAREDEQAELKVVMADSIDAPADKGTQVGTVFYSLNNEVIGSYDVCIAEDVTVKTFWGCMKIIRDHLLL